MVKRSTFVAFVATTVLVAALSTYFNAVCIDCVTTYSAGVAAGIATTLAGLAAKISRLARTLVSVAARLAVHRRAEAGAEATACRHEWGEARPNSFCRVCGAVLTAVRHCKKCGREERVVLRQSQTIILRRLLSPRAESAAAICADCVRLLVRYVASLANAMESTAETLDFEAAPAASLSFANATDLRKFVLRYALVVSKLKEVEVREGDYAIYGYGVYALLKHYHGVVLLYIPYSNILAELKKTKERGRGGG